MNDQAMGVSVEFAGSMRHPPYFSSTYVTPTASRCSLRALNGRGDGRLRILDSMPGR